MKTALILNPNAALFSTSRMVELVRRFSKLGPVIVTANRDDLAGQLRALRNEGIEWLALCGGDGTYHVAIAEITQVWETIPRLIFFHGGTMGIACREIKATDPFRMLAAMEAANEQGAELVTTSLPTLDLNGRISFNFGLGMIEGFARQMAERRGRPAAVWGFAAHLTASILVDGRLARDVITPWRGGIGIDNEPPVVQDIRALYASPLEQMWVVRGYQKVHPGPGQFRVMSFSGSPSEALRHAPGIISGLTTMTPMGGVRVARQLVVTCRDPFTFVADGEHYYHDSGSLTVGMGPRLVVALPKVARAERRAMHLRRAFARN